LFLKSNLFFFLGIKHLFVLSTIKSSRKRNNFRLNFLHFLTAGEKQPNVGV